MSIFSSCLLYKPINIFASAMSKYKQNPELWFQESKRFPLMLLKSKRPPGTKSGGVTMSDGSGNCASLHHDESVNSRNAERRADGSEAWWITAHYHPSHSSVTSDCALGDMPLDQAARLRFRPSESSSYVNQRGSLYQISPYLYNSRDIHFPRLRSVNHTLSLLYTDQTEIR